MISTIYNGYNIQIVRENLLLSYDDALFSIRINNKKRTELWSGARVTALLLKCDYPNIVPFSRYLNVDRDIVDDELHYFDARFSQSVSLLLKKKSTT